MAPSMRAFAKVSRLAIFYWQAGGKGRLIG